MNRHMIKIYFFLLIGIALFSCNDQPMRSKQDWAIAIHGGAGSIIKGQYTKQEEKAYQNSLKVALQVGTKVLKNGGTAVDAVEQVIIYLENDSLFNAGKGAVLAHNKKAELDASIMDGSTLEAGAVASVTTIKHPISAARAVMEKSPHVLLMGRGAEEFAESEKLEIVDNKYFITKRRKEQLENRLKAAVEKHGTVGVVALDKKGNLAAGTSTGGMLDKKHGRVGDSPIIGAGTYADNKSCAVSCTGHGEYFIRLSVAHKISELMKLSKMSVQGAANEVILEELTNLGGAGGVIALDGYGNYAMPFNTGGMFRAYANSSGTNMVKMFK